MRIPAIGTALTVLTACMQPAYDPDDTRIPPPSRQIDGMPLLMPANCRTDPDRMCRIDRALRFTVPATNGLTWASKAFGDPASEDGTTDGASIPQAVWGLIGLPYDPLFLRPAILHDHYTYEENLVRDWRDTHRMFFYALREEGVDAVTAQIMFYAVYTFGGHWTDVQSGENCGDGCVQLSPDAGPQLIYYPPTIDTPEAAAEIQSVFAALQRQPQPAARVSDAALLAQIDTLAQERHPADIPMIDMGPAFLSAD